MITYGVKSWKAVAFPAIFFFCIAVFLFFHSFYTRHEIRKEQKDAVQVEVPIEREKDIASFMLIKGIERSSVVYEFTANISCGIYNSEFVIRGIDAEMITGDFIGGNSYTETREMPYLVFNEAAIKEFGVEEEDLKEHIDWLQQETYVNGTVSRISGIVRDKTEEPFVYISVDSAKRLIVEQGQAPNPNAMVLELKDAKDMEKVQEQLEAKGYVSSMDEHQMAEWKYKKVAIQYQLFAGIISFMAFLCIILSETKRIKLLECEQPVSVKLARVGVVILVGGMTGILVAVFSIICR